MLEAQLISAQAAPCKRPVTRFDLTAALTALVSQPLFVLSLRVWGTRWLTGQVAVCVVGLLGWFLANANIQLFFADLDAQLRACGDNPLRELAQARASDGAPGVFGILFGGFDTPIYYAAFALVHQIARAARRHLKRRAQRPLREL